MQHKTFHSTVCASLFLAHLHFSCSLCVEQVRENRRGSKFTQNEVCVFWPMSVSVIQLCISYYKIDFSSYRLNVLKSFQIFASFPITYIIIKTFFFQKSPCTTCNRGSNLRCCIPSPLNEGLALIKCCFCSISFTYQMHLKLDQCLEIDDRRSLSKFGDVT